MAKKWYKPKGTSKSKKERTTYSADKGVRGWVKNQERFEDACTEKKNGKAGHVYVFSLGYRISHFFKELGRNAENEDEKNFSAFVIRLGIVTQF